MIGLKVTLKSGTQVTGKCNYAESLSDISITMSDILIVHGEDPLDDLLVRTKEIAAIEVTSYVYKAK